MEEHTILTTVILLIGTAISVVAIFKRLNLSPVLGYLVAGALIGDNGAQWVSHSQISFLGEFGVVFLLFAIGLELSFERLKAMRKYVFGLGSMQVFITMFIVGAVAMMILGDKAAAIIIGGGLALSSTAIVLQVIEEAKEKSSQLGRVSISILLLQDFIVVPLLVILPLLAGSSGVDGHNILGGTVGIWFVELLQIDKASTLAIVVSGIFSLSTIISIFILGRFLLRRLFSVILTDQKENGELAIAVTLIIVLSAAFGTENLGMSFALGAFMSGVLVAETDFRIRAEHSIYPFKSLLLGLFFMSVGMKIDVYEIYANLTLIITIFSILMALKTAIIAFLCRLYGFNKAVSLQAGLLLSQGGEFAFILFGLGKEQGILSDTTATILLLSVTCSMALTPLLAILGRKIAYKFDEDRKIIPSESIKMGCMDLANHIIIAGFGRVGKMVARFLEAQNINYIVLDADDELVKEESKAGFPIFTGDISKPAILEAASAQTAFTVILAMGNEITIKRSIKTIQKHYPNLNIVIRLDNMQKTDEFYSAGATTIIPEAYEVGLQVGSAVLKSVGISEHEINRMKRQFRASNYSLFKKDNETSDLEDE